MEIYYHVENFMAPLLSLYIRVMCSNKTLIKIIRSPKSIPLRPHIFVNTLRTHDNHVIRLLQNNRDVNGNKFMYTIEIEYLFIYQTTLQMGNFFKFNQM